MLTPSRQIVVIGGSAGAIAVLKELLPPIPASFERPIVVVVHHPASPPSLLPTLFAAKCAVPVREPMDKEAIDRGIWFAPAGYHLLVEDGGTFALAADEPVQHSRPSIDVLFESAAHSFGSGVLAIVLTGANHDGANGTRAVLAHGGVALAQTPESAMISEMPSAAVAAGARPLPIQEILQFLLSNHFPKNHEQQP